MSNSTFPDKVSKAVWDYMRLENWSMSEFNPIPIDQVSYQLGMITAFAEVVAAGVKKLGLSPPLDPEKVNHLMVGAEKVAKAYGVSLYLEKDFLTTDLFNPEFTRGKHVLLIYEDPKVLDAYMALKAEKEELLKAGKFQGKARKEIAVRLGRLLSYQEDRIEKMLSTAPNAAFILD